MTTPPLPEQIELHRDRMWRRDEELRVESAIDAERFIENLFASHYFPFINTITEPEERDIPMTERGKILSGSIVLKRTRLERPGVFGD